MGRRRWSPARPSPRRTRPLISRSTPPRRLVGTPGDTGGRSPPAFAELVLSICGAPVVTGVEPIAGPLSGDVDLLIFGSGFAGDGAFSTELAGTSLEAIEAVSSTIASA